MMKKIKDYAILFLLAVVFVMTFKYSTPIKNSILSSLALWVKNLIPSMLPIYIILDLALNYGLLEISNKVFKNNAVILVIISLVAGTPTNAKYIKEFYEEDYIDKNTANFLLLFSYSPNPLFIMAFSPTKKIALWIILVIILSNLFIFLVFKPRFKLKTKPLKKREQLSFIDCLSSSIAKSTDILVLILGVVVVYGVVNTVLSLLHIESVFLNALLELTNALAIIESMGFPLFWAMFACLFGGLSIHTQVKSILESTDLSYKYFLLGRTLAALPLLILACLY